MIWRWMNAEAVAWYHIYSIRKSNDSGGESTMNNNKKNKNYPKCVCVCACVWWVDEAISQQIISLIVPFQSLPIFLGDCCCWVVIHFCCIRHDHEYYGFILIGFVSFYIESNQMSLMRIIRSHCLLWTD